MLFNSLEFLIFFPITCVVYFLLKKENHKQIWLLLCSYYFYMSWNATFGLLMLFSTIVTFFSGICIKKYKKQKKIFLILSLVINLLILFSFKYLNFFISNLNHVLNIFNITNINNLNILLPVGISFYTFQALSYTIDVYRGDIKVENNFIKYALFVSFFPQLVAGPIEKSKVFLKQFHKTHEFKYDNFRSGLLKMLYGYVLKLVIADRAAIVVNNIYNNLGNYTGFPLIIATILFAIQIYCDFYSYSIIAKGAAEILDYKLSDNFNSPYLATSIKDFWRRWHISLSTWFKEYLYIPLGGNRVSQKRMLLNILIVFTVSGLWHGAAWTYIIWGVLHGIYQIIGILTQKYRNKIATKLSLNNYPILYKIIKTGITFILVDFAWIFFRANNLKDALYIICNLFKINKFSYVTLGLDKYNIILLGLSIILLFLYDLFKDKYDFIKMILKQKTYVRWIVYFAIIFIIIIFGVYGPGFDESQFIYFRF